MSSSLISTFATIVIAVAIVLLSTLSRNKETEPFTRDKAEWQYESAMLLYCNATGKQPEELEESDTDIIWENACNHCSMFLLGR